jgi:hypothetical protein
MSYLSCMRLSSAIQHVVRFLGSGTFVGYLPCLVSNCNSIQEDYIHIHEYTSGFFL